MPQTWGLTRVSQGAAFAPRGGCPLGAGLSPGLPTGRELPPRVVTACSIRRRRRQSLSPRSLRLCVELVFLFGSGFIELGNRPKVPPELRAIPTVIRDELRAE